MILLSLAAFAAAVPFARTPLPAVPAFLPACEAMLVVVDLLTAALLFGEFVQLRSAALFAVAAGYLFDALMVVPHALSFPGLLTPSGWLGAGAQTTAWLYMFWHGGFPLFVIAYAALRRGAGLQYRRSLGGATPSWSAAAAVCVLATLLTLAATRGHAWLPEIMAGNGYAPAMKFVVGGVWALTAAALLALLLNRPYSLLDLWLIVVMVAWFCDIGLSAVLNAGRFDLGFYGGRLFGLLAAGFVLAVLVVDTSGLHARLASRTARLLDDARSLDARVREQSAELAITNRRLSAILQASPLAIFMLDRDGRVVLWNASAERIFGYAEDEALGRLPPYLTDAHMTDFRANIARAEADATATGYLETQRRRKDGAIIDVSVRWARVNDGAGQMLGVVFAVADVTVRKKIESHLQQAQKMEAVGTLTGGMAHDFNNLLGIIILNLDVLRERVDADPESEELAQEAMTAAIRGAELIRRLLAFARRQPLQPERTDVNALVAETAKLLERTLGEAITVKLDLGEDVWLTVVDPAQLESSLTNLATNARDAMPKGGDLTIATGNRHLDADYAAQYAEVTPGDYAMIEVSDSGSGMPNEVLARAFEPFFTTKHPGKGTGLGLSMVYGFIKQSGGHINVYSEPGVGTTVRLYLPRADADLGANEAEESPGAVRGSGETVLAVEDNPGLRRVVVRQLSELGYRVIAAEDARAAVEILESEPIALLFTDVVLPGGTSGYELAQLAAARWPDVKVVLTSGFPEARISRNGNSKNLRLLAKPYRKEDIARVVRDALSG